MLASAVIAAAMMFGGAQARAGYVSVPAMAGTDGVSALSQPAGSLLTEHEASAGMGGAAAASLPRPDTDDTPAPKESVPPFPKLTQVAHNFGQGSGAGSSSSSSSSTGPSTAPAGDLPRPQVPPLELASLLPPEKGDAHPFSVASFLFRPPRAA